MREFTFKEIGGNACGDWKEKAKEFYKEFVEEKGRKKFTFLDVMTNLSIDDDEHDMIFIRMVDNFSFWESITIDNFDNWLFGDGKVSPHKVASARVYREMMYALMRTKQFEKLLEEYLKHIREED